jgi:hypothetical protein
MRSALKGRQIERTNKAEADSIMHLSISPGLLPGSSTILSPLQDEPFILRIPGVETPG